LLLQENPIEKIENTRFHNIARNNHLIKSSTN